MQSAKGSANSETTETALGDGCIDDTLVAEPVQETLCDLVCAVVLSDLLTQNEDLVIGFKLLGEGLIEGLSDSVVLGSLCVGICP